MCLRNLDIPRDKGVKYEACIMAWNEGHEMDSAGREGRKRESVLRWKLFAYREGTARGCTEHVMIAAK